MITRQEVITSLENTLNALYQADLSYVKPDQVTRHYENIKRIQEELDRLRKW